MPEQTAPISNAAQPPAKTEKPQRRFKRVQTRVRLYWLAGGLLVLLVVVTVLFKLSPKTVRDPFSSTQRAAVGIPLYYPAKLPKGYHINYKSVNIPQKGAIIFVIDGPSDNKVYVSEEPTPSSDIVSNLTGTIIRPSVISTSLGNGTAGLLNKQQGEAASILTNNKTWIIVNSNTTVSLDVLKSVLENLVVSN